MTSFKASKIAAGFQSSSPRSLPRYISLPKIILCITLFFLDSYLRIPLHSLRILTLFVVCARAELIDPTRAPELNTDHVDYHRFENRTWHET